MFGVLALVVTTGVCAGIVGVDSYRKHEQENRQKSAEERWKKANDSFFKKTTNRSMEVVFEQKLRKIIFGSQEYPEIIDEIKATYDKWINDEPYYIKYLGTDGRLASGSVYDHVLSVLLIILMANRGYITTGAAVGGIKYNSVNPSSQSIYLAEQLDEMLRMKGIHEELYAQQDMCDPQKLSCNNQLGYTGCIFWKPKEPILYY